MASVAKDSVAQSRRRYFSRKVPPQHVDGLSLAVRAKGPPQRVCSSDVEEGYDIVWSNTKVEFIVVLAVENI